MSWRVEHADPLAVLRELPGEWAQTCITSPPHGLPDDLVLAVLGEAHRALRADGTLWLLHTPRALPSALEEQGWRARPVPWWYSPLAHARAGLLLLAKEPRYFCEAGAVHEYARLRRPACRAGRAGCGEASCRWRDGRELHLPLRRLCVLAASAPVACGACGAPWRRSPHGGRRAGCAHNDPRGRCLILDPFCRSLDTALLASRYGRSFLGITEPKGGEW